MADLGAAAGKVALAFLAGVAVGAVFLDGVVGALA
jgi:hypothetical protein